MDYVRIVFPAWRFSLSVSVSHSRSLSPSLEFRLAVKHILGSCKLIFCMRFYGISNINEINAAIFYGPTLDWKALNLLQRCRRTVFSLLIWTMPYIQRTNAKLKWEIFENGKIVSHNNLNNIDCCAKINLSIKMRIHQREVCEREKERERGANRSAQLEWGTSYPIVNYPINKCSDILSHKSRYERTYRLISLALGQSESFILWISSFIIINCTAVTRCAREKTNHRIINQCASD